jgi:hypothetical protein
MIAEINLDSSHKIANFECHFSNIEKVRALGAAQLGVTKDSSAFAQYAQSA